MNYSKISLTGGADFVPIKVHATAIASGTVVHTAGAALPAFDEVYVNVTNTDGSDRLLTLAYGGTTDPDNLLTKTVTVSALSGPTPVLLGQPMTNAKVLLASCDVADKLTLSGFVNRAT